MEKIETRLQSVLQWIAAIGALCLLIVAGISVVDILVRYFTGRPLDGAHDVVKLLVIIVVASCFPAGLMERRQITVTLIRGIVPPLANRIMRTVGAVATLFMFSCIAWFISEYAAKVTSRNEYSMVLGLPVGPWWTAASVLIWACIPAQIYVVFAELCNHKRPVEEE